MQNPLNCGVSGCQNYPIRIKSVGANGFLYFSYFCARKLLDDLSPTAHCSLHNRKSVRANSPETKSSKKRQVASNVKGKNLCNLTIGKTDEF